LDFRFWIVYNVYNTRLVCQHFHIYLCYCSQNAVPPRRDDLEKLATIKLAKDSFGNYIRKIFSPEERVTAKKVRCGNYQ
jgi:hypothetical protein